MCGIAGIYDPRGAPLARAPSIFRTLLHRGPDDQDASSELGTKLLLVHTRLSVIELTDAGHQPMESRDSRYVLILNGEIYNHQELRKSHIEDSFEFRGASDTETLVELIARQGIKKTLPLLEGMFAFAAFDRVSRVLWLARDRAGEKPLYIYRKGSVLSFGSEPPAIRAAVGHLEPDNSCLADFLHLGYIPSPFSAYKNVEKLPPAHYLRADLSEETPRYQQAPYWEVTSAVRSRIAEFPSVMRLPVVVDQIERFLAESVTRQIVADVPVGAFLSGGVDSSLVVALFQELSGKKIKTFTIAFEEPDYDESMHARKVAEHLGTEHTEYPVSQAKALSLVAELPAIYSEPFADSSQIPTALVSFAAREHVTVCLTGDGGDELFGGYNRYLAYLKTRAFVEKSPPFAGTLFAKWVHSRSTRDWNQWLVAHQAWLSRYFPVSLSGDRLYKLAGLLAPGPLPFYERLVSQWLQPSSALTHPRALSSFPLADFEDPLRQAGVTDFKSYLPDDILVKVDRAAMAVSLETRAPFLSKDLIEYGLGLDHTFKISNGTTKLALRKILEKRLPAELVARPKMGFGVPLPQWLRGDLKDWANELLTPQNLEAAGFNHQTVLEKWRQHQSGERNWHGLLWPVLSWLSFEHYQKRRPV
jgi:asparagine synthase (glutamine-hydrolysing)